MWPVRCGKPQGLATGGGRGPGSPDAARGSRRNEAQAASVPLPGLSFIRIDSRQARASGLSPSR
jgi:hypothetical protein